MTQEDKELLLKDLYARLRYSINILTEDNDRGHIVGVEDIENGVFVIHIIEDGDSYTCDESIENFKPYLRPMSSMTKEEHGKYMDFIEWSHNDYDGTTTTCINKERLHEYLNFIYSHHLDDNNFIEKGLALEAPDGMYK